MAIKREKDGTIKGVVTMGDLITKSQPTKEQLEAKKKKEELEKKYGKR